jgi:hypothetical protein
MASGRSDDYRLDVDDKWWFSMMVLFHADRSNTRYNWFLYRFANAWTNDLPEFSPDSKPTSGVVNLKGLQYEDPPYWVRLRQSNQQNAYVTPGPLGMNLRAMSMIALHASRQENESDADRRHVCFALAQLRCAAPSTPLVACAGSCTSRAPPPPPRYVVFREHLNQDLHNCHVLFRRTSPCGCSM